MLATVSSAAQCLIMGVALQAGVHRLATVDSLLSYHITGNALACLGLVFGFLPAILACYSCHRDTSQAYTTKQSYKKSKSTTTAESGARKSRQRPLTFPSPPSLTSFRKNSNISSKKYLARPCPHGEIS